MHKSLFKFIWERTRAKQIWILLVILASMPPSLLMLELPKQIVNGPIQGKGFETADATKRLFEIDLSLPLTSGTDVTLFGGFKVDRLGALIVLSAAYLGLVILSGLIKYYINTYKGRLGELMLQQLRYELFDRVLRFPLGEFRRVKAGEIATMIKDEVEPLGGFIGDSFVQPVFLGGQILTALGFILAQSASLAMIAIALLALQVVVIPRLRRIQINLSRQRQVTARQLAGRIGEVIDDMATIRAYDVADYQRADIAARLTKIFRIRFSLYQWKFLIKFLNNLIAQFTPFLFYLIGGYFAIKGRLDIGQLVAVIGAYKDLPSPVKDLIDWDQERLDVEVKYHQVMDQFTVDGLEERETGAAPGPFEGEIVATNLGVVDFTGARQLDGLQFRAGLQDAVAFVGPARGGADTLAEVLAGRIAPSSGSVQLAGFSLRDWPRHAFAQHVAYVGPDAYFQQGSILEALATSLRQGPPQRTGGEKPAQVINAPGVDLDFEGDWIDYAQAGAQDMDSLVLRMGEALHIVDLYNDVVLLGLNRPLQTMDDALRARILDARRSLRERLTASGAMGQHLVEPFDPLAYNRQCSVAENILFGTALQPEFEPSRLASNPMLRAILDKENATTVLYQRGREIANTLVELFGHLSPDHPLLGRLEVINADDLPMLAMALNREGDISFERVTEEDRATFINLALSYVEPRDRLGLLDEEAEQQILKVRAALHAALGDQQNRIAFYHPDTYNEGASVQDNILLGRMAHNVPNAREKVGALLQAVVDELDMRNLVFRNGLDFNIGSGGRALTLSQRQRLSVARALLRRPNLLIIHSAMSSLDAEAQTTVMERIVALHADPNRSRFGLLTFLSNPGIARLFERVIVVDRGKVIEDCSAAELSGPDGYLMKLVA